MSASIATSNRRHRMLLVTGATGYVGGRLVKALESFSDITLMMGLSLPPPPLRVRPGCWSACFRASSSISSGASSGSVIHDISSPPLLNALFDTKVPWLARSLGRAAGRVNASAPGA